MILAITILILCTFLLGIIIHALFFADDSIEDVELMKKDLIDFINKL